MQRRDNERPASPINCRAIPHSRKPYFSNCSEESKQLINQTESFIWKGEKKK